MADSESVGCGIAILVIAGIGWAVYSNHQEKSKAAAEARVEAKAKAGAENAAKREEEAAITLTKEAHTLTSDWPPKEI